jgi:autotransporter-associated beta strand protein
VNSKWDATALNWSGAAWTSGNDALFDAKGARTVYVGSGITANSLTFNAPGYRIAGGPLTLTGEGKLTSNSDAIISSSIAAPVFTKAGSATVTLSGTSQLGNATVAEGVLDARGFLYDTKHWMGAPVLTIGAGATLRMHGWGFAGDNLGQLNAAAGNVVINGGTIEQAGDAGSVGAAGAGRGFSIGPGGATLQSDAGTSWEIGNGYPFVLSNNSRLTLAGAGTGRLWPSITGTGSLSKNGSGTWTLSGSNDFNGEITVNSGTLSLECGTYNAPMPIRVASGATLSLTGPVEMSKMPTLAAGSTLELGLGTVGASGAIRITGAYEAPARPVAITISNMQYKLNSGVYNLITGADGISAESFVLHSKPAGSYALSATNGTLSLRVTLAPSVATSALGASGTIGSAFRYQIALVKNPTGYGAKALPPGLSLDPATGLISGTPTEPGTYFSTISSTCPAGTATSQLIVLLPMPLDAPELSTSVPRGYFNHVPESANYTLVYSLDIPSVCDYATSAPTYSVDTHLAIGSFSRVAYYLELQAPDGTLQYLWVSMQPFTNAAGKIGVPTNASDANFQQAVSGMNVVSNVSGVVTGTGLSGTVQFSPQNAGSMVVGNSGGTLFGFANWGSMGGIANLGIGGSPLAPATAYQVKSLKVLVLDSGTTLTVQPVRDSSLLINPGKGFVEYFATSAYTREFTGIGYSRPCWSEFEPAEGKYNWNAIDSIIADFASCGRKTAFGVINTTDWFEYATPKWVFDSGAVPFVVPTKTNATGRYVVPASWRDPVYLAKMKAFISALGKRYNGSANIAFMDMRNYGIWGEGNGGFAAGMSSASPGELQRNYYAPYLQAFPNTLLLENAWYPSVGAWLVSKGCGSRMDCIMSGGGNGASGLITYPNHPLVMEYCGSDPSVYRGGAENELLIWVTGGRPTYLQLDTGLCAKDPKFYRMIGNLIGYHLILQQATIPKVMHAGTPFQLEFKWFNDGVAPLYEPCSVAVALLDANNQPVQKKWLPNSHPGSWMPGLSQTEKFTLTFSTVPPGYKLAVGLFSKQTDANPAFKLGNQGRTPAGWQILSGSIATGLLKSSP